MANKKGFLIDRWLERFCNPHLYEGIRGDLLELLKWETEQKGARTAAFHHHLRTIGFFRMAFYHRTQKYQSNTLTMWQHYLSVAIRNLRKHKAYTLINILGLTIGMTAGFMILQYVFYESTYDQFFENKENIYRVRTDRYENGQIATQWASGASGAGILMKEEFPEVLDYVKLTWFHDLLVKDRNYYDYNHGYFATANFFEVFSIPLKHGDPRHVLTDINQMVISERLSQKIFGNENPVGKEIETHNGARYTVTGVFENIPDKSHIAADLFASMETRLSWLGDEREDGDRTWHWDGWTNYIILQPGTSPKDLMAKFPEFIKRNPQQWDGESEYVKHIDFVLQPLPDIHLTSNYRAELKETGDSTAVKFLLIIGMFVLFIAWINYINLTTARALSRAKEVGIRKVLGGHRSQLVKQFLFESSLTNLLAIGITAVMIIFVFPYFSEFVSRPTAYTWPDASWFWTGLVALLIVGTLLSGFYPALVLSGFRPIATLKGKFTSSSNGNMLRKGLVVTQFLASIGLITGTYVVYQQLSYLKNQSLGVNIEQTLIMDSNRHYLDSISAPPYQVFKNLVTNESEVKGFTTTSAVPGGTPPWNAGGIRLLHQDERESNQYRVIRANDQFIDFFGLEVVVGRGFDQTFGNEYSSLICNEIAVERFGLSSPEEILNQKVYFWGDTFNVVGVVKNYRQASPKSNYEALLFRYSQDVPEQFYAIRLNTPNMRKTIDKIEEHWRESHGEKPFSYFFLEDHYNNQYQAELRFGSIFAIFSGLAIFVACLGLFGLASFMTSLRLKEVGIRKVLGASFAQLWLLLTKDFVKLVGVAIVVSIPLTWYVMNGWLEGFANRISLSWWLFAVPALLLLLIALLTVSYQTIGTVNTNPAETLKDE